MKKLLLISLMLIGTSNVFAKTISCTVDILLADKAGYLMPSNENLSITTKLINEIDPSLKNCGNINRGNLKISLCATETEFVGGISTALVIQAGQDDDFPTISTSLLATLKNGKGLTEVNRKKSVLNSFNDKILSAEINVQSELGEDSASLDEVVKQGMLKGVLSSNEPVVISIGECQLSKK